MDDILTNFSTSIFPVVVVIAGGYILRRWKPVSSNQISHIAFYVMLPALIFKDIYRSNLPVEGSLKMICFIGALITVLVIIGWIVGFLRKARFTRRAAFILSVTFMNCGNLGLSVNENAFGGEALAWAGLYFVVVASTTLIVGVYIAESGKASIINAMLKILKQPIIYAVAAGFIIKEFQIEIPGMIWQPITIIASGAIPLLLVLLGIQMAEAGAPKHWGWVGITSAFRLVLSPLIAFGLAQLIGLQGLPFKVAVLQSGMPIAMLNGVIASEYDLEPNLVASSILISTLLSPISLSILISQLNYV